MVSNVISYKERKFYSRFYNHRNVEIKIASKLRLVNFNFSASLRCFIPIEGFSLFNAILGVKYFRRNNNLFIMSNVPLNVFNSLRTLLFPVPQFLSNYRL